MTADRSAPPAFGVVAASTLRPQGIPRFSELVETLEFGELWFGEDCFYQGGVAAATAALCATSQIPVGLGVVSSVTRHPAILGMEPPWRVCSPAASDQGSGWAWPTG